jgi:hypothetical protein
MPRQTGRLTVDRNIRLRLSRPELGGEQSRPKLAELADARQKRSKTDRRVGRAKTVKTGQESTNS